LYRAKYAVNAIKKKVNDKNPHVALYALEVISAQTSCDLGVQFAGQGTSHLFQACLLL